MNWLLDPSVSTHGPGIDRLYYIILIITGVVFLVTQALLIGFLVRYRGREGRRAAYIHGSTRAEVMWTGATFVVVVVIALMSWGVWQDIKNPVRMPADAYEIVVTARQFEWNAVYAGPDGVHGTSDDFSLLNRLHIPVDRPIKIILRSEDVIHSFWVPDFRVKQDAVPGMETPVWFSVTEPGEYAIGCAELCGLGHYRMRGTVVVHPAAEYDAWNSSQVARGGEAPDEPTQVAQEGGDA